MKTVETVVSLLSSSEEDNSDSVDIDLITPPLQRKNKSENKSVKRLRDVDLMNMQSFKQGKTETTTTDPLVVAKTFLKNLTLRKYQEEGVRWMLKRNNPKNTIVGGILADEMGVGKTIETIAMIAASNPRPGGSTLIVSPFCVLAQWMAEIRKFSTFDPVIFHGGDRKITIRPDAYNIVLTTYGIIVSETKGNVSVINVRTWDRIIIDEGHAICNPKTKRHKDLLKIKAREKWILTGTPVRNRGNDFFALLQFLGYPTESMKAIEKKLNYNLSKKDGLKMLHDIADQILLRREKSRIPSLRLPQKNQWITEVNFDAPEREVYNAIALQCRTEYDTYVKEGTILNNYIRILALINKLRMTCVHVTLGLKTADKQHIVDKENLQSGSKLKCVFRDIYRYWIQDHRKIIIFSQWTSALDICQNFLVRLKIGFARYDGKMDLSERTANILKFKEDPTIGVFLVSIKAGGEGLNLCEASVVLILDPMWNTPAEEQAIDRVHRIGQNSNVDVIRYVTKDTIEENVVALQRKKRIHEKAIMGDGDNFNKLELEDLKLLFKMPESTTSSKK